MPGAACSEPAKRRVRVPSDAVASCSPSSPVGRCERREQRERCEDARRWNNEFIAACHPAMAISTIRHCKLPLKGRASPTTPTLRGPRLIGWGRAGEGGDRGKGDREGGRDPARWKEGRGRERGQEIFLEKVLTRGKVLKCMLRITANNSPSSWNLGNRGRGWSRSSQGSRKRKMK